MGKLISENVHRCHYLGIANVKYKKYFKSIRIMVVPI